MCDCSSFAMSAMPKCAAALAAVAGQESGLAALNAATPASGWAQARDFRASSTLLDERSFAGEPERTNPMHPRDPCPERMPSNHLEKIAAVSASRNRSSIVQCKARAALCKQNVRWR